MARNRDDLVTASLFLMTYKLKCHLIVISSPVFLKDLAIQGKID
jgi:hypothetical protein